MSTLLVRECDCGDTKAIVVTFEFIGTMLHEICKVFAGGGDIKWKCYHCYERCIW